MARPAATSDQRASTAVSQRRRGRPGPAGGRTGRAGTPAVGGRASRSPVRPLVSCRMRRPAMAGSILPAGALTAARRHRTVEPGTREPGGRAAATDGGARAPRRRVEQGRGDHGPIRRRGRRRAGRHLHRRRARQRAQPEAGPARGAGRTSPRSAAPRWTGPARSSASGRPGSGFVDSGLPEGDPLPPLPEGCFGLVDPRPAAEPLVRLIREFRPHVVTTYDEDGGYPHPDHIMCHKVSVVAFDAAGDPERLPGAGRAVAAAEALLPHRASPRRGSSRCTRRMLAAGLESPYAEWLERWSDSDDARDKGAADHHPGASAASTSRSATTRCGRTPPRSTRTGSGSTCRWRCSRRPGRPRTSSWPGRWSTARCPEDDLFAGVRETLAAEPAARP